MDQLRKSGVKSGCALTGQPLYSTQVGVLTPYAAQKAALSHALAPLGVCVDTVDGWQGMERDLIFFSATRCEGRPVSCGSGWVTFCTLAGE